MGGRVLVDGTAMTKAGTLVGGTAKVELTEVSPYVSRGGMKLEKAVREFRVDLVGKVVMDVGASTGGFTQCVLLHGAKKVYAIDVGSRQIDCRLASDPRVVVLDRINIRYLHPAMLSEKAEAATVDLSFISLEKVWDGIKGGLHKGGEVIALVKPQFEAGPSQVARGGVVRDPLIHQEVLLKVIEGAKRHGFSAAGLTFSPIRGQKGNIEFFLHLFQEAGEPGRQSRRRGQVDQERVEAVVLESHQCLSPRRERKE